MAGMRVPPLAPPQDDSELPMSRPPPPPAAGDLVSDDDRSVAADSWSIKSEYGSTLDDDQRHADAADALAAANFPVTTSEYSFWKAESHFWFPPHQNPRAFVFSCETLLLLATGCLPLKE